MFDIVYTVFGTKKTCVYKAKKSPDRSGEEPPKKKKEKKKSNKQERPKEKRWKIHRMLKNRGKKKKRKTLQESLIRTFLSSRGRVGVIVWRNTIDLRDWEF